MHAFRPGHAGHMTRKFRDIRLCFEGSQDKQSICQTASWTCPIRVRAVKVHFSQCRNASQPQSLSVFPSSMLAARRLKLSCIDTNNDATDFGASRKYNQKSIYYFMFINRPRYCSCSSAQAAGAAHQLAPKKADFTSLMSISPIPRKPSRLRALVCPSLPFISAFGHLTVLTSCSEACVSSLASLAICG